MDGYAILLGVIGLVFFALAIKLYSGIGKGKN